MYRYVAKTVSGFVQQLACGYVKHGYLFYVAGQIPENKDPGAVDQKLISRYCCDVPRWERSRRKRRGEANVQYLRFRRTFFLIATHGEHLFFSEEGEGGRIQDIRREPVSFYGYSIGYTKGQDGKHHVSVRIHPVEYRRLKAYFLDISVHRSVENLTKEFKRLQFEPYARVKKQYFTILKLVNERRGQAGFEWVPYQSLRLYRKMVKPFGEEPSEETRKAA